ncbi:MAG: enoyl-CoA hydratase, partial [Marinobacter sp.]|nr:enoyl-CoA hydratase [Marinobacter sp.]
AEEAYRIGLANRIVPDGQSREAAETLAQQIAGFPQRCLKADLTSARGQWDLPQAAALKEEGRHGYPVVFEEAIAGAGRFASGAGRHGRFED